MGAAQILVKRVLPVLVLVLALFLGWLFNYEYAFAILIATTVPITAGKLPPTLVGHGKMSGTPEVPDDMTPQRRPRKEKLLSLPGGRKMPQSGLGMCCRASAYDDVLVYRTVLWYLLLGGRHIDTAQMYMNHKAIGKAIAEAISRGVKREEIFVTTKIPPTHYGYNSTKRMVPMYLEDLGLDYIDLVLMHFPSFPIFASPCKREGLNETECRRETWLALSEFRQQGALRNVGVSNFAVTHLKEFEGLGAPIANNQIQFHPFEPEHVMDTISYCHKNKITITAYSPLGGMLDKEKALANDVLNTISSKHGDLKAPQIMLRWAMQRGCAVIPGTGNPKHMEENLAIYDFKLTDEDMNMINDLKHSAQGFTHIDVRKVQ